MSKKVLINDFTSGNIPKQLLSFSFPFMLSNALQVLYSWVDMIIVGKYVGSEGLSAVSTASQLFVFMTMLCVGFSNGAEVIISQQIGANLRERLSRTIGTFISILTIISFIMTFVGLTFGKDILHLLNTPDRAYNYAWDYIFVCSIGVFFSYGYNAVAAILKGMGNSRLPFVFILIASVLNIVLDLVFIKNLGLAVQGAALATIIGQAVAFLLSVLYLYIKRHSLGFDLKPKHFRIDKESARLIFHLGVPFATQSCTINISMMFVNSLVNQYDIFASAAFGVGIKIDDMVNKVTQGMAFATSNMCAQNVAAKEYNRTRKIVWTTLGYNSILYIIFVVLILKYSNEWYSVFTDDPEIIGLSQTFAKAIVWGTPAMTIMRGSNSCMRGIGNAKLSLILALVDGVFLRIALSYLLGTVCGMGLFGFFLGYSLAPYGTAIPGLIYFISGKWESFKLLKD